MSGLRSVHRDTTRRETRTGAVVATLNAVVTDAHGSGRHPHACGEITHRTGATGTTDGGATSHDPRGINSAPTAARPASITAAVS